MLLRLISILLPQQVLLLFLQRVGFPPNSQMSLHHFRHILSGVNTSAVYFAYSTTGSSTPTNWANVTGVYTDASCQNLAADGATGTLYALIGNVPFNQDSASQNTIRISVTKNNGMQSIQLPPP